jgi:hypothetical protein
MPSWKKLIVSGSDAVLRSLNVTTALTASGFTYPTVDGEFGVEVIKTDGAGKLELEIPNTVYEYVKNVSGGFLSKGTPVHSVGTAGFQVEVIAADAGDPTKMPATLILAQDLNDEGEGLGIAIGAIQGVNTTGLSAGDPVWVAVGGGFTQTKPTGSALIQNLGIVTKIGTNGGGIVLGAGRSNDVPNLPPNTLWVGNENWVATPVSSSTFYTGSYTGSFTGSFVGDGSGLTGVTADTTGFVTENTFNSYTSSTDSSLNSLEIESGSIRTAFNSYTSSANGRLNSLEVESGSIRTNFNSYTSSTNNRLNSLETESGSIRTAFNLFTGSYNTGSFTGSFIGSLTGTATTASYITFANVADKPSLVSGSSQIDHDQTTNFVANKHIDHSTVSITASSGLSGGGNITATRTLTLDTGSTHFTNGVKTKLNADGVHSGSFLGTATTTNLTEGTNLYYTDTRVKTKLNADGVHSGSFLGTATTTNLTEGTNLYYTDTRVKTKLNTDNVHSGSFLGTATTTNLTEGTNLYYTDARVKTKLNTDSVHSGSFLGTATTTNLTEGTNLYYTDTRVKTKLNADGVISGSSQVDINSTTGTLNVNKGGTGQTTYTNGQLLIGNTTGNTLTKATLTGTSNQIIITNGNGSITLSLPQNIHTSAIPTFSGSIFNGDVIINGRLLNGQQNLDVDSGAVRVIATIPTGSYDAAFFDYVIKKGTDRRAGTIYAVHNGTTVEFTETSTNDIGTTTDVTLSSDISGGNIRLLATTLSNDWIIKTLVRGL